MRPVLLTEPMCAVVHKLSLTAVSRLSAGSLYLAGGGDGRHGAGDQHE